MRIKRIVINRDIPLRDDEGVWSIYDLRNIEHDTETVLNDWEGKKPTYLYVNTKEEAFFFINLAPKGYKIDLEFSREHLSLTVSNDIEREEFYDIIKENEKEHKQYAKNITRKNTK